MRADCTPMVTTATMFWNEAPALLMILIVVMVVVKPL